MPMSDTEAPSEAIQGEGETPEASPEDAERRRRAVLRWRLVEALQHPPLAGRWATTTEVLDAAQGSSSDLRPELDHLHEVGAVLRREEGQAIMWRWNPPPPPPEQGWS